MYTSSNAVTRAVALLAMSILVAACGGKDEESTVGKAKDDRASATRDEAASGVAPTGPVKAADDRMANAVATSKTAAAVDLRYALQTKPEVGQPFEVELAFHPRVTADALEIEATGITGLTVVSGGSTRFEKVVAGERYAAKVLAQAGAAGLYYIGVSAKMVTSVQTDVRTFSVPVVVGTVPAEAKTSSGAGDAVAPAGEAVKSMPAVETTK